MSKAKTTETGSRIGYGRVSTADQSLAGQLQQLQAAGCSRIFKDEGVSGTLASRPQWDACLAFLRPGDALVITRLDRAGRNVRHLLALGDELQRRNVDLIVTEQGIDTTTSMGRLMYGMLAVIAEFERDLISERTKAGLAATGKRGRNGGRKAKLQPYQVAHARAQLDAGVPITVVADELGVHRATIYRSLSDA